MLLLRLMLVLQKDPFGNTFLCRFSIISLYVYGTGYGYYE